MLNDKDNMEVYETLKKHNEVTDNILESINSLLDNY